MGMRQAIVLQDVARAVVVHHHVHLGGFDQLTVDVEAEETMAGRLADFLVEGLAVGIAIGDAAQRSLEAVDDSVHGDDQKAARTAAWIANFLARLNVEHLNGHALNVARSEKFAPVTA